MATIEQIAKLGASSPGANGKVSVGTSSTQIVPANANRVRLMLSNRGAASVFVAFDATAVQGSGFELEAGGALYDITYTTAINGITASGTVSVAVLEEVKA